MTTLDESRVVDGFHSLLQVSLAQAQAEGLLSVSELTGASEQIQLSAPSFALFIAALQARDESIAMPDGSFVLNHDSCPVSLKPFFEVWRSCIKPIQALELDDRHDLARSICGKQPKRAPSQGLNPNVHRILMDLQLVAMEINLRSSFQNRFGRDLQHVVDGAAINLTPRSSGETSRSQASQVQYQPPPSYDAATYTLHQHNHEHKVPSIGAQSGHPQDQAPSAHPTIQSNETSASSTASLPASGQDALMLIRETLFSSLADSMATNPALAQLVARGHQGARGEGYASRAYFAALTLSILDVALYRVDVERGETSSDIAGPPRQVVVRGVQTDSNKASSISLDECPKHLIPMMLGLGGIASAAQTLAIADDQRAMRDAEQGKRTKESEGRIAGVRTKLLGTEELIGVVNERRHRVQRRQDERAQRQGRGSAQVSNPHSSADSRQHTVLNSALSHSHTRERSSIDSSSSAESREADTSAQSVAALTLSILKLAMGE
ncbi:hypothetical protein IE81DRAFT_308706 [Ceraceosorus guamensis]|uniref:Uncharacterized protein n=1 Tax=Ceraceosorus guamensis TaxID=1522189 RepID=A0A316W714_9BASI|nr:hypothetical protein IE81DRAFT_308706 [Ceraceosorus guamensis]PWN45592.1 hypothetical protein IE81DRAFT_308706 [Ceraceosorus guamensis]